MPVQVLLSVFANAALPQKIVLLALLAAAFLILWTAIEALLKARGGPWRSLVPCLRTVGPALGLLVGAADSFHMARTIQRVPFEPTAKQLAPGMLEVSTLVGLGALVGLMAAAASWAISAAPGRSP